MKGPCGGLVALAAALLVLLGMPRVAGQGPVPGILSGGGVSNAVRSKALPLGVSQILFAPQSPFIVGNNRVGGTSATATQQVPGYGASIAWTPTTTGQPRVIVGSVGVMTNGSTGRVVYGAAYVYTSEQFSFTMQQTILPPSTPGSAGLLQASRFGASICASPNSAASPVLSGTNLWIGQSFAVPTPQIPESVYFYSATTQTTGLTRADYLLQQTLQLSTPISCNFGTSMASSHSDMTLVVGAPGYPSLAPSDPGFRLSGPTSGRVFVFQWNTATSAYTAQAILTASQFTPASQFAAGFASTNTVCPSFAGEVGFGAAVAMSGNVFVVGSLGSVDVTGQLTQCQGNVYVFTLQAPIPGLNGAASAFSVARPVQVIPNLPVSNALALSMTGNYLCVGVQQRSQVVVMLTPAVTARNPSPNFLRANMRTVVGGGSGSTTGMGQIVVSQTVDGLLYVYMGQPNINVGAIFMSTAPNVVTLQDLGIQGGLEPGFGTSIAFNRAGNYLFAGNYLNNPHALVVSLYYETLGKAAARQRLISNDVQTANGGVFSNFGAVISGQMNSVQSVVAVGASLGPTLRGRVYIYTLQKGGSIPQFSLQAEIVSRNNGTNFGSSLATMLSTGNDIAILVGAPATQFGAYIDIFIASASGPGILATATGVQRLVAPVCEPPSSNQFSCGANYAGNVVVDGTRIIAGAHNFGVQPGTGRVYVYLANLLNPRSAMFSLSQTLVSPPSELGFGVSLALANVIQNANTPPVANSASTNTGTQTTMNVLVVAAMGQPLSSGIRYPYNQPAGVGMVYVYVNTLNPGTQGAPYSMLQVLSNAPVQLTSNAAATGSAQSMTAVGNDLFVGSSWRNEVRFYRYNGVSSYSLQQTLVSPYGGPNYGAWFGSSIFNTPQNRGLLVGAPGNGTVFMYLNAANLTAAGTFSLQRVLAARPIGDQFGSAVTSCGETVVVGAPGANIATIYPISSLLALPAAQLSLPPTLRPTPRPTPRPAPRVAGVPTFPPVAAPGAPTPPILPPTVAPSAPVAPPPPTPAPVARPPPAPIVTAAPTSSKLTFEPTRTLFLDTLSPTTSAAAAGNGATGKGTAQDGLSPGAVAGIVVGVLLFFAAFMGLLWCNNRHKGEEKLQMQALTNLVASGAVPPPVVLAPGSGFGPDAHMPRRSSRGSAGAFDHHQVYRDSEIGGGPGLGPVRSSYVGAGGRASLAQPHRPSFGPVGASLMAGPPPPHLAGFGPQQGWERNSVARASMARGSIAGGRPGGRASMHHEGGYL